MKLTEEQWEDISSKLAPKMSADDVKKVLSDSSYDYDDEDIEDILVGIVPDGDADTDKVPDDPDESSEKPHDEGLAGEKTPEEDFMQRAAAGEVPATSNVLAGDLTPEEIEMIQMMRAGKEPPKNAGLADETTPEENEMLNITNRLAKNLSKHRW